MKQKSSHKPPRQRYSPQQIAQALEIISQSDRDFSIAASRTGIKIATLKSWWYKNNTSTEEPSTLSAKSIIARKTAIQAADMQIRYLQKFNKSREEDLNAIRNTLGLCIDRIAKLLPTCNNIHLLSEATRAVADVYKSIATISPENPEKGTETVTNNFTSIIAQINNTQEK